MQRHLSERSFQGYLKMGYYCYYYSQNTI